MVVMQQLFFDLGVNSEPRTYKQSIVKLLESSEAPAQASPQQAPTPGIAGPDDQTQPASADELASVISGSSHAGTPKTSENGQKAPMAPSSPVSSLPSSASQMGKGDVVWLNVINIFLY